MFRLLSAVFRWLFSKTAMVAILWTLVIGGAAVYIVGQRYFDQLPEQRKQRLQELTDFQKQKDGIEAKLSEYEDEIATLESEIARQQKAIKEQLTSTQSWQARLKELQGMAGRATGIWDFLRGDSERIAREQRDLRGKIKSAERGIAKHRDEITASQASQEQAKNQAEGASADRDKLQGDIDAANADVSEWDQKLSMRDKILNIVKKAYHKVGTPLILATLSILFLPLILKMLLFYLWAPLASLSRPIVIRTKAQSPVRVSETAVSQELVLQPGQSATIQHKFYQASDQDVGKRTKFLFSWRYPFSCLSAGLVLLTRTTNKSKDKLRRLTLSSQDEAEIELAVVELPDDSSLVCRPTFLAALITEGGRIPRIRSHWRFFSIHSWITLQFRYFEFRGPVKLVLWAYRGVRAERMTDENVRQGNEKRTNQYATIGFTPSLHYKSARSETFVSYLRNHNPLFDDLFSGKGVFLCQQVSRAEHLRGKGRFWASIWNGLTKILGI